jgi:O-antigen ligase
LELEAHKRSNQNDARRAVAIGECSARTQSGTDHAVATFIASAATVVWLAVDQGAYFPESWGLPALALLWVAMLVLVFGEPRVPGPLSLATLAAAIGLTAWTGLSVVWSAVPARSVLELERAVLYLAAVFAALLLARGRFRPLIGGVATGLALVCLYALAVRLLPGVFGIVKPRPDQTPALNEPVGYSNALGALAALGVVLSLGFVSDGRRRLPRALAGAAVVPLLVTMYFTFSRGAWLAFAVGVGVVVATAPSRVKLLTMWLAGPLPLAGFTVLLASRADALARVNPRPAEAAREGALLLAALLLAAAAAGASTLGHARLVRRVAGRGVRAFVAVALVALVVPPVTVLALGHSRTAGRTEAALRGEQSVSFALGRRDTVWRAAWNAFGEQPLAGRGAGTFGQYWLEHRDSRLTVQDAHNLYLETLAELGVVGLALLVVLFAVPLVAGASRRSQPLVPASLGALTAYLAHASIDWDWELPALTVAAILVAAGLVTTADGGGDGRTLSPRFRGAAVGAALAVSVFAAVGVVGNRATVEAERALAAGKLARAEADARRAAAWSPWSPDPLRVRGRVQLLRGDRRGTARTLHAALAKQALDWRLWLDLATVTTGAERERALAEARRLNPREPLGDPTT